MKRILSFLTAFALLISMTAPALPTSAVGANLIANPSAETVSTNGQPTNWTGNSWGTNTANAGYAATGHTGSHSLSASLTARTDGDTKWIPDAVTVNPNRTYTYTDYYKASVGTELDAQYTDTTGNVSYVYLSAVAPATSWQPATVTFTTPANAAKVSILHILAAVGTLQTDDFSLTDTTVAPPTPPAPDPSGNLIPNASFETMGSDGKPAGWAIGSWGTNAPQYSAVSNDGHTGTHSSKLTVSNYADGDAKWYFTPITTVKAGQAYSFSAWYKTNTLPSVTGAYTDTSGVTHYFAMSNPSPAINSATTWQQYKTTFTLPAGATSFTVYMLLTGNGWLQTDDYSILPYKPSSFSQGLVSLTFDDGWQSIYANALPLLKKYGFVSTQYIISGTINGGDGYMTSTQIKAFKTQGSEIASHTVSHPDLTTLTAKQLDQELSQSRATIQRLFGTDTALNFASPYGSYNPTAVTVMKKYYRSHRSTDTGYNSKDNFDAYNILVQNIEVTTTPAQVNAWVNQAIKDKTWLVLVYHDVNTAGDAYSVTPKNLDSELSYIKSTNVSVKTVDQALATIKPQLSN